MWSHHRSHHHRSHRDRLFPWNEPVTIAILPDHPTPCSIRTHTANPVPFLIYRPGQQPDDVQLYDEFEAQKGAYGLRQSDEFMKLLLY